MSNITIERIQGVVIDADGTERPLSEEYAALIEGCDDDGRRWAIWLDGKGRPCVYYPEREADGAVIGEGIPL